MVILYHAFDKECVDKELLLFYSTSCRQIIDIYFNIRNMDHEKKAKLRFFLTSKKLFEVKVSFG